MNRERLIWTILLVLAVIWIIGRMATGAMPLPTSGEVIGTWVAAFFTLALFSFLYRDNPFYKFAEHVFVGVSAAYWMIVAFWTTLIPNLLGNLAPDFTRATFVPGLKPDQEPNILYLAPLILGILLLWRLSPKGGWIGRWPLAFIIGATAGLRLIAFLEADFVLQVEATVKPLVVYTDGAFDLENSVKAIVTLVATLCGIVYFFFSVEHKGFVGKVSRVGIWVLMITFGAGFGYTVMGRIALFAIRLEFLFDDWLWLIDPLGRRAMEYAALVWPALPILG